MSAVDTVHVFKMEPVTVTPISLEEIVKAVLVVSNQLTSRIVELVKKNTLEKIVMNAPLVFIPFHYVGLKLNVQENSLTQRMFALVMEAVQFQAT